MGPQLITERLRPALKAAPPWLADVVADGIAAGRVRVAQREGATAAWWFPRPGTLEIIAVVGKVGRDTDWLLAAIGADMRKYGATVLSWTGDREWGRLARRLFGRRMH